MGATAWEVESAGRAGGAALDDLDALDTVKRRAYAMGLSIAVPMELVGLALLVEPRLALAAGQVLTVVLYLGLLAVLLGRRPSLGAFERTAFRLLAIAYLLRVGTTMASVQTAQGATVGLIASCTGVIVIYILAFVAFDKAAARNIAVAMAVVTSVLTAFGVASKPPAIVEAISLLAPWLVCLHAIIIVLLYVFALAKEKMTFSMVLAEALGEAAATDPLTGVANRRELSSVIADRLDDRRRAGTPLSLVLIDLDHFKRINDTFGHATGDDVLREVCARLQGALRATDTLGRWGGEEFLVVAPSTDAAEASRLAERCGAALQAESIGPVDEITASFGVATAVDGEDLDQLLCRADAALYDAKRCGRARVAVAPSALVLDDLPG